MAKKKYICAGCNKCTEPCTVELSGDADMTKDPAKMLHCGTWVEVPAEENTNKEQLPKLTTEVFSMEECPEWAQYAAVDTNGTAYWYDGKPEIKRVCGGWINPNGQNALPIGSRYDASDWRSSLIERPAAKLTAEVFSMEECPNWAQYAAVDPDGEAYWYDSKPRIFGKEWNNESGYRASLIGPHYDASDWKNSTIERPAESEQLPKLTVDVFSFRDCPKWAQYAAVDAEGIAYWYDAKPKLDSQAWRNASEYFNARQITLANIPIRYDKADWRNSLIERPAEQRTKLTHEVFSMLECPKWARYAAVDSDGVAYWYEDRPELDTYRWGSTGVQFMKIARGNTKLFYDSSDWKNSLIQRRKKLTEEIFNHPECPDDAVVAVVNADGTATWGTCAAIEPYGGGFRTKEPWDCHWTCIPGGACFDATDWQHSRVRRLRKLTEEIFDHPKCPADAVVAVVNASGTAAWGTCADIVCDGTCAFHTDHGNETWTYIPGGDCFDVSDWKNSAVYRAGVQPKSTEPEVPKLTYDVFSCSTLNEQKYVVRSSAEWNKTYTGCPAWARYAAVDRGGAVFVYENKPMPRFIAWTDSGGRYARVYDADKHELQFDGTDWEHSLIEHPVKEQLPKLAVDVFSAKDCPEWARYAAVDENGFAYWYEMQPQLRLGSSVWFSSGLRSQMMQQPARFAAIIFDSTDWMHSLIERQPVAPRPKLTAGVFFLSECPEWARYAAIDANGLAYWYDAVPCRSTSGLRWNNGGQRAMKICYAGEVATPLFDATDWEHSLIERPAVVPAWFKPGVLAYNNDTHTFFHVTDSIEYCENYLEAKVRPFNDDELERKLGQCVLGPKNSRLLVTGFRPKGDISGKSEICVLCGWLTAEKLLTYGSRPQGIKQYHSKAGTWIDCGLSS